MTEKGYSFPCLEELKEVYKTAEVYIRIAFPMRLKQPDAQFLAHDSPKSN